MPRRAGVNGWVSSARPPAGAGPIAATEEVWTSRSTPAASASSAISRVPPTLTSKVRSASAGASEVLPATWKTRSTPSTRAANRAAVGDVAGHPLELDTRRAPRRRTRAGSAAAGRRRAPTSARARCEPSRPVAPVTRVLPIAGDGSGARSGVLRARDTTVRGEPPGGYRDRLRLRRPTFPSSLLDERGVQQVSLYVVARRRAASRARDRRLRQRSSSGSGRATRERRPRSLRSATSSTSTARCSTRVRRSSRSTSPPGSRAPTNRPAIAAAADRRGPRR